MHSCVTNVPGVVSMTSTFALTNATMSYISAIAISGFEQSIASNPTLKNGVNVIGGVLTKKAVADSHGLAYSEF